MRFDKPRSRRSFNSLSLGRTLATRPTANTGLLLEALEERRMLSVNPVLLGDLGDSVSSNLMKLTAFGNWTFFNTDLANGGGFDKTWRTDGTEAGTAPFHNFRASDRLVANGSLYLNVPTGGASELWKSDGTEAGSVLVKSMSSGGIKDMTNVNGTIYFISSDQLWQSDGTTAGTVMVKDTRPGGSGFATKIVNANGTIYFFANDGTNGLELWKSDGSAGGTAMVADVNPSSASAVATSSSQQMVNVGTSVYFVANDGTNGFELWKSDGSVGGTALVKDIRPSAVSHISGLMEMSGIVYFEANDGSHGTELWRSDGSDPGTYMVKEIGTGGTLNAEPEFLTNWNGTLYFTAKHGGGSAVSLFQSDGTEAGTTIVKTFVGAFGDSSSSHFPTINGNLYFSANDGTHGSELWKSDGTEAGTVQIKNIAPDIASSAPLSIVNMNGTAVFAADDKLHGIELWKSDGSEVGTAMIADLRPEHTISSEPEEFTYAGGVAYFVSTNSYSGTELWKTDGTPAGTQMVKDINPGSRSSNPNGLFNFNGILLFRANDGTHGEELWRSDGTEAGTVLLKDIRTLGFGTSDIREFTTVNNTVFFLANDGTSSNQIWKTDGTHDGTMLFGNFPSPGSGTFRPKLLTNFNGDFYFVASDNTIGGPYVWNSTDGTTATKLQDAAGHTFRSTSDMINFNGVLFFSGDTGPDGPQLWQSNGTPAGTFLLKTIYPGASPDIQSFTVAGDKLYFIANDGTHGFELWKTNGTTAGTVLVDDITDGPGSTTFGNLVNQLGTLTFTTTSPFGQWQTDGTASGTVTSTYASSAPMRIGNELFYFDASGLHRGNGKAAGSTLVFSTSGFSSLTNATVVNGSIMFAANKVTGIDPWLVRLQSPTDISLSPASVLENQPVSTTVGSLSTVDGDVEPFTYELIAGAGSTHNALFTIDGGQLKTNAIFDYESQSSYSVRVRSTDLDGHSTAKALTITISDVNEAPPNTAPQLDLNGGAEGTDYGTSWSNSGAVPIVDSAATLADDGANLAGLTATLSVNHAGDVLSANTSGTSISASFAGGILTLSGSDTVAHYEQVLRTITYNNTAGHPLATSVSVDMVADDGALSSNTATATIDIGNSSIPVGGRKLFYNQSKFDGNNAAANASDDAAIATDKTPYIAGSGAATFANMSSYTKGINGIMIDLSGPHGTLTEDDFIFRVGNNNSPGSWLDAPAPATISIRGGAGLGGADRIEIIWANNAIEKQWLEVIVKGNDALGEGNLNTGLAASDVFFWGNALANSSEGDTSTAALTNATDEVAARNHPLLAGAAIDNLYDYDRSGGVNATDQVASRNNSNIAATAPRYLNIGGGGPFAPEGDAAGSGGALEDGEAVASALASTSNDASPPSAAPAAMIVPRSETLRSVARADLFAPPWQRLSDARPRRAAIAEVTDDLAGLFDEDLLALLASRR